MILKHFLFPRVRPPKALIVRIGMKISMLINKTVKRRRRGKGVSSSKEEYLEILTKVTLNSSEKVINHKLTQKVNQRRRKLRELKMTLNHHTNQRKVNIISLDSPS